VLQALGLNEQEVATLYEDTLQIVLGRAAKAKTAPKQ